MMVHGANKGTVHVVIDLETVNITPWNPAIFQVGLAMLTPDGHKHYWQGTRKPSVLEADLYTWNWWQEPERVELFKCLTTSEHNSFPKQEDLLKEACYIISELKGGLDIMVWGNSPTFDLVPFHVLLGGKNLPWTYRDERDLRTVFALKPWEGLYKELPRKLIESVASSLDFKGFYTTDMLVRHNAVYDAALELENLMYVAPMLNLVLAERA